MTDAKIATREDVKDVYAEGLSVGMKLGQREAFGLLASAMKKVLPPALLAEVIAHLDPVTPFIDFLRTHDETPKVKP